MCVFMYVCVFMCVCVCVCVFFVMSVDQSHTLKSNFTLNLVMEEKATAAVDLCGLKGSSLLYLRSHPAVM